jgi:hypothetical protein
LAELLQGLKLNHILSNSSSLQLVECMDLAPQVTIYAPKMLAAETNKEASLD